MARPSFEQATLVSKMEMNLVSLIPSQVIHLLELESPLVKHKILDKEVYWVVRF